MPPQSKKRVSKADDYDSDGGFVEDAPKSKKAKTAISKNKQVDDDGNPYWEVRFSKRSSTMDADRCSALWKTPRHPIRVQEHALGESLALMHGWAIQDSHA